MAKFHTLTNKHLVARFDINTGRLVHLSTNGRGKGVVKETACRYAHIKNGWHTDGSDIEQIVGRFESSGVKLSDKSVQATYAAEHVAVTLKYELPKDSSLLRVTSTTKGNGKNVNLAYFGAPGFIFADGFNNTFEDDVDLYCDGAELGGGRELPLWRVFFQKGHRKGLMIAARSKAQMSHFEYREDRIHVHPHVGYNYTDRFLHQSDVWPGKNASKTHVVEFEIGPWTKEKHRAIIKAAKLEQPTKQNHPKAVGKPKRNLKGKVFYAADVVSKSATSKTYKTNKWMVANVPWAQKGKLLFAGTGVRPPVIRFDPKLTGLYRVVVGIGNARGVLLKTSRDPEMRIRINIQSAEGESLGFVSADAFRTALAGKHAPREVDFGVYDMTKQKVTLGRHPAVTTWSAIDYVRFEPLTAAQTKKWEAQQRAQPIVPFSGLNDIPDIAPFTDCEDPDPRMYASNIWEHAECKFEKIYWRIDGQCCDYQSKVNTMRYVSAKVHNNYSPQAKAYGRVLKKTDMLKVAVDAAKKHGVELWGWQRFNSYIGNVQSDFYKNNPKYWDESESGSAGRKLCLAHKAVRDHKISILVEAAKYGLDGLCLGFLRHPPVHHYAPVMVNAYKKKYGRLPPSDPKNPDQAFRNRLPPTTKAYQQWYTFRAEYVTKFGRELRAALRKAGLSHVKIALWVRPNHCLFDGINIPDWLDEGLCDQIVSGHYSGENLDKPKLSWETPAWRKMVRAKVPLIREVPIDRKYAPLIAAKALKDGCDGLCTYESDYTVLDNEYIDLYRSLCREK